MYCLCNFCTSGSMILKILSCSINSHSLLYGKAQRTGGACLEATSGFVEFVSSVCLQGALILNACLKCPIVIIKDHPDLVVAES